MGRKSNIEDRGLLQPEEFDIDELDYLEPSNGHARKSSKDWSRSRRRGWLRSRCFCWSLVVVVVLLVAGAALNKGGKFKIPKLPEKFPHFDPPTPPTFSDEPEKSADTEKPEAPGKPQPSKAVEPSVAEKITAEATSSSQSAASSSEVEETATAASLTATSTDSDTAKSTSASKGGVTATKHDADTSQDGWTKPKGFKIIGLIFYGRPDTVAILDCYLRKNLAKNGGWLDEVHFVMNTEKEDDIKWLDDMMENTKEYNKVEVEAKGRDGYGEAWGTCNKKDMYIKIDDDIVFFTDDAIPNIVYSLMHHPEALNVVATLINCPRTGFLHYRLGAIHAYLPEKSRTRESLDDHDGYGPTAWRASKLPEWHGEDGEKMEFPVAGVRMGKEDGYVRLPPDNPGAPPYKGHRWLPLPGGDTELWRTPAAEAEYNPDGKDWASWSLGAQAHYSFLQNLENDTLDIYHFGHGLDVKREGLWNMAYERMNINFMAIWGKDVKENLPFESFDDELALSVQVPIKLRRRKFRGLLNMKRY